MKHYFQPKGSRLCGQYCVAMVADKSPEESIEVFGHSHGTKTKEVIAALKALNVASHDKLIRYTIKTSLPDRCIFKIKWNTKGSHWAIYDMGLVYDPYYGTYDFDHAAFSQLNGRVVSYLPIL